MKDRTINRITVQVTTKTIAVSKINASTKYQRRHNDNPWERGAAIAQSVRENEATEFRDNILVVSVGDGTFDTLDGFGRTAALPLLGWETVEVDVLSGNTKDRVIQAIAATANCGNVSEKTFNSRELAANAYLLSTLDFTYEEIAAMQQCGVETVKNRVMKGKAIHEYRASQDDLTAQRVFNGKTAAECGAKKVLNTAFNLRLQSYKDHVEKFREEGIELRLLAGNNEKQVKGLLFDLLEAEKTDQPTNFIVLFYIATPGAKSDSAWNAVEKLLAFNVLKKFDEPFFFTNLSSDLGDFDCKGVRRYIQGRRKLATAR